MRADGQTYLVAAQMPLQDVELFRDFVHPLAGITKRVPRTLSHGHTDQH